MESLRAKNIDFLTNKGYFTTWIFQRSLDYILKDSSRNTRLISQLLLERLLKDYDLRFCKVYKKECLKSMIEVFKIFFFRILDF